MADAGFDGQMLAMTSGSQFRARGVSVGDGVIILSCTQRALFVVGMLRVGQLCDTSVAIEHHPEWARWLVGPQTIVASDATRLNLPGLEVDPALVRGATWVDRSGQRTPFLLADGSLGDRNRFRGLRETTLDVANQLGGLLGPLRPLAVAAASDSSSIDPLAAIPRRSRSSGAATPRAQRHATDSAPLLQAVTTPDMSDVGPTESASPATAAIAGESGCAAEAARAAARSKPTSQAVVWLPALTVRQPYAGWLVSGRKTVELRTWPTRHRGPLLITSSRSKPEHRVRGLVRQVTAVDATGGGGANGHSTADAEVRVNCDAHAIDQLEGYAVGVVWVSDCRPMAEADSARAGIDRFDPAWYAWVIERAEPLTKPYPIRGFTSIWRAEVPAALLPAWAIANDAATAPNSRPQPPRRQPRR